MTHSSLPHEPHGKLKDRPESADESRDGTAQDRDLWEKAEAPKDAVRKRRSKAMMQVLREDMDTRPGVYEKLAGKRDRQ